MLTHHFAPVWLWCAPCTLRPHLILKLETIARDGAAVIRLLNLTSAPAGAGFPAVHVTTPFERAAETRLNSRDQVAEYYGQLSRRQVRELYQMYRLDHELFDYSPEPYIALAKKEDE
jgi:Sulfotransferase family